MPRLRCADPEHCGCRAHVTTEEWLPCCPSCHIPLVAHDDDPEFGFCPCQVRGYRCLYGSKMVHPDDFEWKPRHVFSLADIPFHGTWKQVQIRQEALQ
jgi:hypothetical protein